MYMNLEEEKYSLKTKKLRGTVTISPKSQVSFSAFRMRPDILSPSPVCRKCMSNLYRTLQLGQFKANVEGSVIALMYFLLRTVSLFHNPSSTP